MARRYRLPIALTVGCAVALAAVWGAVYSVLAQGAPPPGIVSVGGLRAVEPPRPMPDLDLARLDGTPLGPDPFGGKVTLLNVWATWCAPCVKEMPSLDRLQARLGGDRFAVVAVSVDRGGAAKVAPFVAKTGIAHLTPLLDPNSRSMQALTLRGLPTTLLIDAAGREVARLEGAAEWDSPAMVAELERVIGAGR